MRQSKVTLIGAPFDLGGVCRTGHLAPAAFRAASVVEHLRACGFEIEDGGDVPVFGGEPEGAARRPKHLDATRRTCAAIRDAVVDALAAGRMPVVLGGDHSIAIGTIAGAARFHAAAGRRIGLVWIDAHDDMNTPETTRTGNLHGMSLAVALGLGEPSLVGLAGVTPMVQGTHAAAVALREIGEPQRVHIAHTGLATFHMRELRARGIERVMAEAIARASDGTAGIHVSFDLDALDPAIAPGVGTPSRGGLSYEQARLAMTMLAASGRIVSIELVELNPARDIELRTVQVAIDLLGVLLGAEARAGAHA